MAFLRVVQPGRHHRNAQTVAHRVVERRPDDHLGVAAHEILHDAHHLTDFGLRHRFRRRRHVHEKTAGPLQVGAFQKRAGNRLFGRFAGAVGTGRRRRPHHGRTAFAHHRTQIFEVHVDDTGRMNDFGNAVTGLVEHVVRGGKAVHHRRGAPDFVFQLVVENDDEAVHLVLQIFNAGLCLTHTTGTFEFKGFRHDGDRENAEFLGDFGNDGGSPRTGAAAHAGRNKEQMCPFERFADLVGGFLRGHRTHFRFGTGAEAGLAERNHDVGPGAAQRLFIRVGGNERNAGRMVVDHVFDGVAAATADPDNLNAGIKMLGFLNNGLERHVLPFADKPRRRLPEAKIFLSKTVFFYEFRLKIGITQQSPVNGALYFRAFSPSSGTLPAVSCVFSQLKFPQKP